MLLVLRKVENSIHVVLLVINIITFFAIIIKKIEIFYHKEKLRNN